jgi:hypothetical protein
MMSRRPITEPPAYGPSRGGNHPKTLRGPVGKESRRDRAVIPGKCNAVISVARRASLVVAPRGRITTRPADIFV